MTPISLLAAQTLAAKLTTGEALTELVASLANDVRILVPPSSFESDFDFVCAYGAGGQQCAVYLPEGLHIQHRREEHAGGKIPRVLRGDLYNSRNLGERRSYY